MYLLFGRGAVIKGEQAPTSDAQIVEQTFYGCKNWFRLMPAAVRGQL